MTIGPIPPGYFAGGKNLTLGSEGPEDAANLGHLALILEDLRLQIVAAVVTLTDARPTPVAHGGIPSGRTFSADDLVEVVREILYPYQYPAFSSFAIAGQAGVLEVGDNIPASVVFNWGTTNPANIIANSIDIKDLTNAIDLILGTANDGTEAIVMPGAIIKTSQASHSFGIFGQNTLAGAFSAGATYSWLWRAFAGTSLFDTLREVELTGAAWGSGGPFIVGDEVEDAATGLKTGEVSWVDGGDDKHIRVVMHEGSADFVATENIKKVAAADQLNNITINSFPDALIEALSDYNALTSTFARTYNFSAGGYKHLWYPASFGLATSWKDVLTGFNVPFVNLAPVTVTNTFGQATAYNGQRSSNILGGAIGIIVS